MIQLGTINFPKVLSAPLNNIVSVWVYTNICRIYIHKTRSASVKLSYYSYAACFLNFFPITATRGWTLPYNFCLPGFDHPTTHCPSQNVFYFYFFFTTLFSNTLIQFKMKEIQVVKATQHFTTKIGQYIATKKITHLSSFQSSVACLLTDRIHNPFMYNTKINKNTHLLFEHNYSLNYNNIRIMKKKFVNYFYRFTTLYYGN